MTCPHGFPKPGSCVDCMNDDGLGPEPEPVENVGKVMAAKFRSYCPRCGDVISPGDEIAATSLKRWICDDCRRQLSRKTTNQGAT